jgi:nucleotide-binding universal stress UspA family protein
VILAAAWTAPFGPGIGGYDQAVRELLTGELATLEREVPYGVRVATRLCASTSTIRALHDLGAREGAAVLVLAPSHLPGPLRAMRGDLALGALHHAPCAVAVAPEGWRENARPPRDVVVGWDGSDEARAALEHAVALARATGGGLRVVHVVALPHDVERLTGVEPAVVREWLDDLTAIAQESLEQARAQVGERVPLRCAVVEGRAGEELARFAAGADLLVTGSRAHGPLRRVVLGSTAADALHRATVPVLVLPRGVAADAGARPVAGAVEASA